MNEQLLEPLRFYENGGAEKHKQNVSEYFDGLLKASGVNEEENRETVKSYHQKEDEVQKLDKKIFRYKFLRVLLILVAVIGAGGIFGSFLLFSDSILGGILLILGGIGLIVGGILLIVKKINPMIRNSQTVREKKAAEAAEILKEAERQMAPLNALFDDTDTFRLIEKTIPELKFEPAYSKKQEDFLLQRHDFRDRMEKNDSVTDTLSGTLCGNPFLYYRYRVQTMGTETYTGFLTISWTETYRDSQGRLRRRRRTQTLTASVTKPKPVYHMETVLGYGCQAAPKLTFRREPTHAEKLNEKELERKVRAGEKKLQKKAEKSTEKGGTFQEMANSEFDVLFGAHDRNHEVEFRLMYTPLAQKNTVELLTSKTGYGDDFAFDKRERYNEIRSEHAQNFCMNTSAAHYRSYDVDIARQKFSDFNTTYFKSVFFDFAPLMAVPVYLSEPCASLEPLSEYPSNYTCYEHEVLANAIGMDAFRPSNSATDSILKTSFSEKNGETDVVNVTAYSFSTAKRVDLIPRLGGDGRIHNVPVTWIEYIPVNRTTAMSVKSLGLSEREFAEKKPASGISERWAYLHGLIAHI